MIRMIGSLLFVLHFFNPCVVSATEASSYTPTKALINQIVYRPIIAADVNCSETPVNDATEVYAWRIFSQLNLPMYYGQLDDRTDAIFAGQLDNWQLKSSNAAPMWSTLLRHNEIKTALPPFERLDAQWQCDENCLIDSPPGRNKTEHLLDGNGNGVKFEIRANKPWLYSAANVLNKTQNLQGNIFNLGHCGGNGRYATLFNLPSILMKIGWKILTPNENPKRFITMTTNGKTYGAVAFHLAMKTGKNWPWVWSTFQHTNNFAAYSFEDKTVPPGFKAASDVSDKSGARKDNCNNSYQPDCIPGLPNYTNQSNTVKRINKVVQQAFIDEQSPLQFYEMLGVQYAKNKADYLYPLRRDCNRKQAIVSPDLYNPILEAFSNHQSPGNSCISCHVNAIYTQPKALFTGAQKEIFSDFSFTPQNFGIPEYLIDKAVGK